MIQVARLFRSRFARVAYAIAVLYFALAPSLDAAAKEEVWDRAPTTAERMLAAFDVLDDVLDHVPGHPTTTAQHHIQLPAPARASLYQVGPLTEQSIDWPTLTSMAPAAIEVPPLERPPRG